MREDFSRGLLGSVSESEWTVFLSSHDIEEVERLCDWVGIMAPGRICSISEPLEQLLRRFQRIEIVLPRGAPSRHRLGHGRPARREIGRSTLSLVHQQFAGDETLAALRAKVPPGSTLEASPMTLREIYLALARNSQILHAMKLILHHLAKDIRAQRWLLLLWLFVLSAQIVMDLLVLQPDYDRARRVDEIASSPFLILATGAAWVILLVRLIASEPVTGSSSFWVTRPIGPGVYLSSKLAFLVLLLVVPSLLPTLLYKLEFQTDPAVLKETLKTLLAFQLFGGLFVIWLITYAPGLREIGVTLGSKVVGAIALFLLIYRSTNPSPNLEPGVFHAEILVLGLLASLAILHGLRRTREGLLVGIVAVLSTLAPWPGLSISVPANNTTGKPVRIAFSPDWKEHIFWTHGPHIQALAVLAPAADDDELEPVVQSIQATFQIPGEGAVNLSQEENSSRQVVFGPVASLATLQKRLPDVVLAWPNHLSNRFPILLFSLDSAAKTKAVGKTGTLTLEIRGRMMSLEQRARIPLNQPHFIARGLGGFIRVRPVDDKENTSLEVWNVMARTAARLNSQNTTYVLIDPQNHTGKVLEQGGNSFSFNSFFGRMDSDVTLRLNGDEPLDRMVLYIFEWEPSTEFVGTLTAPDFAMNPK